MNKKEKFDYSPWLLGKKERVRNKSMDDVMEELQTSKKGLTVSEAQKRLEEQGYNELEGKKKDPLWKLFLATFKDAMVMVLLVAASIQLVIGEVVESIIIFLVLLYKWRY